MLFSCSLVFAQTLQVNDATLSSGSYNAGTTLGITDTDVVIHSNALVHNLFVWGIPWYTDTTDANGRFSIQSPQWWHPDCHKIRNVRIEVPRWGNSDFGPVSPYAVSPFPEEPRKL